MSEGRRLTAAPEAPIRKDLVDRTPAQRKLRFALWNARAYPAALSCGTSDSVGAEVAEPLGFTRPTTHEADVRATTGWDQRWLQVDYPAIATRAKAEGAELCCGDEIAVSSVEHYPRGYAPKGKTPVLVFSQAKCEPINLISAISHLGLMRFMLGRGTMAAEVLIRFMQRFIKDAQRKVLLILDNLRVHQSRAVKMWLVGAPRADRGVLFAQPLLRAERRQISAVAPEEVISNQ